MLHFERFSSEDDLVDDLMGRKEEIQCIVSDRELGAFKVLDYGSSQTPGLSDYADDVDTLEFLLNL